MNNLYWIPVLYVIFGALIGLGTAIRRMVETLKSPREERSPRKMVIYGVEFFMTWAGLTLMWAPVCITMLVARDEEDEGKEP